MRGPPPLYIPITSAVRLALRTTNTAPLSSPSNSALSDDGLPSVATTSIKPADLLTTPPTHPSPLSRLSPPSVDWITHRNWFNTQLLLSLAVSSSYTCSPSWCQPSKQVYLLTELVPAQRAGIPAHQAGASPASRYTCSPSWCQPSEQVYLLTKLVPAQRAGIPAHQAGASPASRYTCSPSWCQPSKQVYLLTELVPAQRAVYTKLVPAQRAGIPAHQAGASPASRYTCSPSWCQPSGKVYLLTKLVPAQRAGIPAHQAGASPVGAHQAGASPVSAHRAEDSPVSAHQAEASPVSAHQAEASPVSAHQAGASPVSAHQAGASPVSAHQAGASPVSAHRADASPVSPHQAGASPASNSPCSPTWYQPHKHVIPAQQAGTIPENILYLLNKLVPAL
ncbi:hypothetical protein PCANC_10214 [Puccinia coronata f. sp. avenae]|uniref:Uncharacterized protein n=1 Tax=Puccinia coronata f. sp. avenae TaxID=200324 RepID=A0A2N5VEL7_9BASI|nr:hypothetical protein PCANC_10214 [Puccinia coronata f. sp. avenae]